MTQNYDPNTQKRLLAVVAFSFLFFVLYDYFFIPKPPPRTENNTTVSEQTNTSPAPLLSSLMPSISSDEDAPKVTPTDALVIINGEFYDIYIDNLGRTSQMHVKNNVYDDVNLLSAQFVKPAEVRFSSPAINKEAFQVSYTTEQSQVALNERASFTITQALTDMTVRKHFTFNKDGTYSVQIDLSKEEAYFITPGYRPDAEIDGFAFHGTLLQLEDETLELLEDGDFTSSFTFTNSKIVAGVDKYFTTMFYDFDKGLSGVVDTYTDESPLAFVRGAHAQVFNGYIGEKNYLHLDSIDKRLTKVIEYGFITFVAKPIFTILAFLHTYIGNWGWSIVALTILIRIIMYPLTYKGMVSMNKIKELAPKVKEIQEKHKDDKQRSSAAMMELYKKHGANPMGGCLPFILQIPIFFAIYRTLLNAIELKGSEWIFWINDLSVQDPYFILPVLMGASMFLQQHLTPSTITDPMQQKIFKYLPAVFTLFFLTFAAGLVLYWLVNNLFSIVQQYYINRVFAKKKLEASAHNK